MRLLVKLLRMKIVMGMMQQSRPKHNGNSTSWYIPIDAAITVSENSEMRANVSAVAILQVFISARALLRLQFSLN